jgi:hypothetical protein
MVKVNPNSEEEFDQKVLFTCSIPKPQFQTYFITKMTCQSWIREEVDPI